MKRVGFLATILALVSLGLAVPVLAAAPGNDTYATRQVIGAIPFSDSLDTSEATTDALDLEANADCLAPATDASVWYEFVPAADVQVDLDATASDYSAGLIVLTGSPGSFALQTCGPGGVSFSATAGVTYTILVFDDQYDGVSNGGALVLAATEGVPPPVVDLTIDALGSFNSRTGSATIRGTIACSGADSADKSFVDVHLTQTVGRLKITGDGGTEFACDGTVQAWAVEVAGYNGKFAGGKVAVSASAFACGASGCGLDTVDRVVTLRK
jgi:hypothetical protein